MAPHLTPDQGNCPLPSLSPKTNLVWLKLPGIALSNSIALGVIKTLKPHINTCNKVVRQMPSRTGNIYQMHFFSQNIYTQVNQQLKASIFVNSNVTFQIQVMSHTTIIPKPFSMHLMNIGTQLLGNILKEEFQP